MVDNAPLVKISAILGLGNPGRRYSANRHNFGRMVVDRIAFLKKEEFVRGGGPFVYCRVPAESGSLILCKSTTYMNNTGRAAVSLVKYFDLQPQDLLVVSDDCNLPLGKIRFRQRGSEGGHNGLDSIIKSLNTKDFPRLRLGIGANQTGEEIEDFVLEDFSSDECNIVDNVIPVASDFIFELAAQKIEKSSMTFTVTED